MGDRVDMTLCTKYQLAVCERFVVLALSLPWMLWRNLQLLAVLRLALGHQTKVSVCLVPADLFVFLFTFSPHNPADTPYLYFAVILISGSLVPPLPVPFNQTAGCQSDLPQAAASVPRQVRGEYRQRPGGNESWSHPSTALPGGQRRKRDREGCFETRIFSGGFFVEATG